MSPCPHVVPNYGAKEQYNEVEQDPSPLGKEETKYIQAVVGTLLYYGQAVDSTILTSLSSLATKQAKPTANTMATINQFLDYCAMQEEAISTFKACIIMLTVHSNAGHANEKHSHSQVRGNFFLFYGSKYPPNNGVILPNALIIRAVVIGSGGRIRGIILKCKRSSIHLSNTC
jgi:hypothetical protein